MLPRLFSGRSIRSVGGGSSFFEVAALGDWVWVGSLSEFHWQLSTGGTCAAPEILAFQRFTLGDLAELRPSAKEIENFLRFRVRPCSRALS